MRERCTHINVRVSEKEKASIERNAKQCGLSLSEFLRQLALGYIPKALPPEELYELTGILGSLYDDLLLSGMEDNAAEVMAFVRCLEDEYINPGRRKLRRGDNFDMGG